MFERCFAMACIVISYAIAAYHGYNGILFTTVVAALVSIFVGSLSYNAGKRMSNGGPGAISGSTEG